MKKRRPLFALVIALALTGCGHTRTVNFGNTADPSFAEINRLAQEKKATLSLADNRTVAVYRLQVTADSTSWWQHGQWETVPTAEIREIHFENRGKGALLGTLAGAAVGILVSQVAGSEQVREGCAARGAQECTVWFGLFESCSRPCARWSYRDQRNLPYAAGAVLGAGIGLLIGRVTKTRAVYRLEAPVPAPPRIAEGVEQQEPERR